MISFLYFERCFLPIGSMEKWYIYLHLYIVDFIGTGMVAMLVNMAFFPWILWCAFSMFDDSE